MKKFFLILSLILVVTFFSVLFFTYPGRVVLFSIINITKSSSCGNEFNSDFNDALKNRDTNFCLGFNGPINYKKNFMGSSSCHPNNSDFLINRNTFISSCLEVMAYELNDIEFCNLITDHNKENCISYITYALPNRRN